MWSSAHAPEIRAVGIAVLALAVVWPRRRSSRLVLAVLGGVVLVGSTWFASFAGQPDHLAVAPGVAIAVALWWAAVPAHAQLARHGGAWWLLLASAASIYACVPETDQMREVAVVVAAGGLAELLLRHTLPDPALVAAAALVEWSALYGATGQGRALVGGLFALMPLIAVAVATAWTRRRRTASWLAWAVGGVWACATLGLARTGGIASSVGSAIGAVVVWTAAAVIATVGLARFADR
jgi:hypothetical protein